MEYDKILSEVLGREDFLVVGRNVVRSDALNKAMGKARYTADYVPRGTTLLKVYRSTVPHALIKGVDTTNWSAGEVAMWSVGGLAAIIGIVYGAFNIFGLA